MQGIMKKKNNKGLTLIELIVAFAIFAIVGVAVTGFVSFCSKAYASSNKTSKLQYEQQMVVNRIRDLVLETSNGVSCGENQLIVFSQRVQNGIDVFYDITKIVLEDAADPDKKELKIGTVTKTREAVADQSVDDLAASITADKVITDTVTKFSTEAKLNDDNEVKEVVADMTFTVGDKEISVSPVIALRNIITSVSGSVKVEEAYIFNEETFELFSKVSNVVISRDGVVFKQSKTDTIAMANDSETSAKYEATVNKKAAYTGTIDETVTWKINLSSILPEYQSSYQNFISIDADGKVTVKSQTVGGILITPNDICTNGYFTISATSNEDPSVSASLRIKVTSGGVYPESIDTEEPINYEVDVNNSQATFLCKHVIKYTDGSELRDEDAYAKIKYTDVKCTDISPDGEGAILPGAGFSSMDKVDGKFVVTRSMQGHTYHVRVEVVQKNRNGEVVFDEFDIVVPKDIIPEKLDVPVPDIKCPENMDRGSNNMIYATWLGGVPYKLGDITDTHSQTEKNQKIFYKVWYEYEISDNDNACKNWGSEKTDKFTDIIKVNAPSWNGNVLSNKVEDGKVLVVTNSEMRNLPIFCEPKLNWDKDFSYRIKLRIRIADTNAVVNGYEDYKKLPYYVPGGDGSEFDKITTNDIGLAYTVTKVVTIPKVSLTLTPVKEDPKFKYNGNLMSLSNIINSSDTIGLGKKDSSINTYIKIFIPNFTGISVNSNNYYNNIAKDNTQNVIKKWNNNYNGYWEEVKNNGVKETAVQLHFLSDGHPEYRPVENDYKQVFYLNEQVDNQLYVYLEVTPSKWISTGQLPFDFRWKYMVYDNYGNSVAAKFLDADGNNPSEYKVYNLVNKYEGEYKAD